MQQVSYLMTWLDLTLHQKLRIWCGGLHSWKLLGSLFRARETYLPAVHATKMFQQQQHLNSFCLRNFSCFNWSVSVLMESVGSTHRYLSRLIFLILDLTTRFAGSSGSSDTPIHLIAAPMPVIYQCFAVSNHIGAHSGSGHYTAHGRRGANWYLFDDSEAIIISGPQKEAYLLFMSLFKGEKGERALSYFDYFNQNLIMRNIFFSYNWA